MADGSCFYDSVLAGTEDPEVEETLSALFRVGLAAALQDNAADGITRIRALRLANANFMRANRTLHGLEWFQQYKEVTLNEDRNIGVSWDEYLTRVGYSDDDADQLQVVCMALLCGKDIMQVSEDYPREDPWHRIPGQIAGWPFPARSPPIRLAYMHQGRHYEPLKKSTAARWSAFSLDRSMNKGSRKMLKSAPYTRPVAKRRFSKSLPGSGRENMRAITKKIEEALKYERRRHLELK